MVIRGKSQKDMEDLLPLYANTVHNACPCSKAFFREHARDLFAQAICGAESYGDLSLANKKTIDNHLTEISGALLGLYYPVTNEDGDTYIFESPACEQLIINNDYPNFFKNLCLNFQFPNGAKSIGHVISDVEQGLNIRPFCYVVRLLYHAHLRNDNLKLSKQEIGYYVLNNLDVLQGAVAPDIVYGRIMSDRKRGVVRPRLTGSREWQHIKEQFNLLELANLVESDAEYIWLNLREIEAIKVFVDAPIRAIFDCDSFDLDSHDDRNRFYERRKEYYGRYNTSLKGLSTVFDCSRTTEGRQGAEASPSSGHSNAEIGEQGEALVFELERRRVTKYRKQWASQVMRLGHIKGLGYDIVSVVADDLSDSPESPKYIEVKSTRRRTLPSFDASWTDSVNLTSKEWIVAKQFGPMYSIFRVYFTASGVAVAQIRNPFQQAQDGALFVTATNYRLDFKSNVLSFPYETKGSIAI